jgi:hypothetical protein
VEEVFGRKGVMIGEKTLATPKEKVGGIKRFFLKPGFR